MEAFKTRGAGPDPDDVRQYKLMCCMVKDVPETFLADVSTGNLATATTLDRPTELAFMALQEEWREDLLVIVKFALRNSVRAPNGRVREALTKRKADMKVIDIREAARLRDGEVWRYREAAVKQENPQALEVMVTFPSIREGDIPQLVAASVSGLTLGQANGISGIDAKAGILHIMKLLGMDKAEEIIEEMFPESSYDPERKPVEPDPTPEPGAPQPKTPAVKEAARRLAEAAKRFAA